MTRTDKSRISHMTNSPSSRTAGAHVTTLNVCHRCGLSCGGYEHTGESVSFCTFFCARHWHHVTGQEVYRLGKLVLPKELPLWQREPYPLL